MMMPPLNKKSQSIKNDEIFDENNMLDEMDNKK
jgi:hypothetical protein